MKIKKVMLYVILICGFLSCNTDKRKITITDFSKSFSDTLYPNKNSTYAAFFVEIKGEVNDSIILEFHESKNALPFYFDGKIDKRLSLDYYGDGPQILNFKPYKATEGKLEIKYGLY
jgi:competence protein ComGF